MTKYLVTVDVGGKYNLTDSHQWELKDEFGIVISPEAIEERVSKAKQAVTNVLEVHGGSIGSQLSISSFLVETNIEGAQAMLRLGGILKTVQSGRNVRSAYVPEP